MDSENQEGPSVEKKLGDLMMRGWTMLSESCEIESNKKHFNF